MVVIMPEQTKRYGELPEAELAALNQKYGKIYTLTVEYDDNGDVVELVGYLKRPELFVMGMALAVIETNPVRAKEIILEKSWLAGDERIKKDDDAFYSAFTVLDEVFMARNATLKKK